MRILTVVGILLALSSIVISDELDDAQEIQYYVEESMGGSAYSQLTVGEFYLLGERVEKNLLEAYAWLYVAKAQGVEESESLLLQAWDEMNDEQRGFAKDLAEFYLQQYSR